MAIRPDGGVYRAGEGEINQWMNGPQHFDEGYFRGSEMERLEQEANYTPRSTDAGYFRGSETERLEQEANYTPRFADSGYFRGSESERLEQEANYTPRYVDASYFRGSENERLEGERVAAEHRNAKESELESKIASGEELSEEDIKYLYTNLMYGIMNGKQIQDCMGAFVKAGRDDLIQNIIANQEKLSVEQMQKQKNGYVDLTVDRNYQFMKTLTTLKELGYDFSKMSFQKGEDQTVDFIKFMGDYSSKCRENSAKMDTKIQSPELNERIADAPELISAYFVEEEFVKNPQRFEQEYQAYLAPKKESDFRLTYEEFIKNRYHIEINRVEDKVKLFQEERDKILAADKEKRMQMFNGQNLEQVEEEIQTMENESSGRGR